MSNYTTTTELAALRDVPLTVARDETASWNLAGAKPWILASSSDRKWHIALRDSDSKPFLLIDPTADDTQATTWARAEIADAYADLVEIYEAE